ncbi:hypothetical protein [Flavobacterium caseinilyticum]|uniref:GNAT family N-acetyltransferase n=1 Tax=Flavobacterium caseinilyticum TaxID=2541732 RepID=A0A4R5AVI6_9FLAO|nr:hypothetical protein [Flavobacterium caseinilyticum]TDD77111.1 hypothetical protein E0F89_05800 [Flavobacterium caseinilyticum]
MEFSVRFLNETDYDVLCQWWKAFRWTAPPRDFLPENGTGGMMVHKDGVNIVAGFIYFTNSAIAWSEFIISNFDYKDKDRKEAIKILIYELNELAKRKGSKYIYTVVKNQNLKKIYQEMGYANGSVKVDEMVLVL